MPHVVFTSDFLDPENIGGSGRVILEVGSRLARQGHRVSIVAGAHHAACWTHEYAGAALDWASFPYPIGARRGFGAWSRLRGAVRTARRAVGAADLLVHNQPLTAWLIGDGTTRSAYFFHSPWSLEYATESNSGGAGGNLARTLRTRLAAAARRWIEARVLRVANPVFTLSETMKCHALKLHGVPEERLSVRPGSADLARFSPPDTRRRTELRQHLGVAPNGTLVACVRRLIPRTGVDLLLAALRRVAPLRPRLRVLVAGRGDQEQQLRDQGRSLVEQGVLRFLGYVPEGDLADLYGAADAAIMPTRALEGFGLSTLEALACGTPVLATPVGGSIEILEGLDPGLLATRADADALAELLLDWTDRPERLAALRERCRVHARDGYDWQNLVDGVARAARIAEPALGRRRLPGPAIRS
ncbi:MAG: glycosyltransferase family 4 protein [Planctomycetota bacterium]